MDADPRRLIARLAVAVMVADGQITPSEYEALEGLDALGLGPMSDLAADEIRNATRQPIDLRATCEGLAQATPEAAALIMCVLAEIAASDRTVSHAELETLHTVAGLLGLNPTEAAHILGAAMNEYGATLGTEDGESPGGLTHSRREPVTVIRMRGEEAPAADPPATGGAALQHAYRVLGIDAAASRSHLDAAYLGLVERYNPVKVAGLGAEFAALAVRKLVEATAAFETVLAAQPGTG